MLYLPIKPEPNQRFSCVLDNQNCTFELYQRYDRLYANVYVNEEAIVLGSVCLDCVSIVQKATTAFTGFLSFMDVLGTDAPQWEGLGDRWQLVFLSEAEVNAIVSA